MCAIGSIRPTKMNFPLRAFFNREITNRSIPSPGLHESVHFFCRTSHGKYYTANLHVHKRRRCLRTHSSWDTRICICGARLKSSQFRLKRVCSRILIWSGRRRQSVCQKPIRVIYSSPSALSFSRSLRTHPFQLKSILRHIPLIASDEETYLSYFVGWLCVRVNCRCSQK